MLDTVTQALDDLAVLAAHICEVPISLVDEQRQWFKAKVGLETLETPREFSFCAHALSQTDLLIVPDATQDARFANNPLVTGEPGIRFYAGAPLVTPGGAILGTLCVIDRVPRTLMPQQEELLAMLARQVMAQLELRRQTRVLAESERFLRTIIDSEPECVKVLGPDGSLRMVNPAGLAMIEADSFGQVGGHRGYPLVVPEHRAQFEALTARVFRGETGTLDYQIVGLKGTMRWLEMHAAPLRGEQDEVTGLLGITRDVTRRKQAEAALRASEARYRTLFEYAPDGILIADPECRLVDANAGICRMLGYTRDALAGMHVADVLGEKEVQIANDTFLKHIQVRTNVARELWTVMGDPTQLHQVLLNLCVNARDAMPDGGTLTLSAQNLTVDAHYAGLDLEARPGPYVLVQVEDTGTGMPPDIIGRIFDPFFTTKEVGKGTGLGLSTSQAIIKSHGGFIRVDSRMGKGARFEVYLPAQTEPSAGAVAEIATEMPRGRGELILVVDDEASVRQITQRTLEAFGYRVVVAADGAEALAIYATRIAEIAAVLTDMTMPVMDGLATIRVLQKINPAVRIVGASGMSTNAHAAQVARLGVKHFLSKPFNAEALLKVLRLVLSNEG